MLRELAHTHGVTVVASIHQPSSQVFALFDSLLLLKAGLTLYHGPRAAAADRFGALLGKARPPDFSAADCFLRMSLRWGERLWSEHGGADRREQCLAPHPSLSSTVGS